MERHLFLKGKSGIGKTTRLLALLEPYREWAGGFLSQRLADVTGETAGFRLLPVNTAGGGNFPVPVSVYDPALSDIFIEKTGGGWIKRPEVFERTGVRILKEGLRAAIEQSGQTWTGIRYLYLDEIGGIELKSPIFMEMLCQTLACGIPCIGVIKQMENMESMASRVSLGQAERGLRNELEYDLEHRFGAKILSYTGREENDVEIRNWISCHCGKR